MWLCVALYVCIVDVDVQMDCIIALCEATLSYGKALLKATQMS